MIYKKYKILFLGRKNDIFSNKFVNFFKKKNVHLHKILLLKHNEKISQKNIINKKFDFIFSFRSYIILNEKTLNSVKYFSLNFHPGPPEYRGIGCVNFAIYEKSKKYGLTAHLMDRKVDSGKIIDVKRFRIYEKDSVTSILNKAYFLQLKQFKYVVNKILKNPNNISDLIKKFKNEKWSKKIRTRKMLNNLYKIKKKISKKKFLLKIRATNTNDFKPYFEIYGKKFYYID